MATTNTNLNSAFLLCEFNASVWTARKLDRKQTDNVIISTTARSKGAARVNKNLLAGRPELDEIQKLVTEARNFVYDNTFPWTDGGVRLIATTRFMKFDAALEDYRFRFNALTDAFCTLYPTLITAQAMSLGTMFDRSEFPMADVIRQKFAFSVEYGPVPTSGDLRVDVIDALQEELKAKVQDATERRAKQVVDALEAKLTDHLERMKDRLTTDIGENPELKPRRFHDTLVSGAFDLCTLLKDYNLFQSDKLRTTREMLEATLSGVSPKDLRDDYAKREDVRKNVTALLTRMSIT